MPRLKREQVYILPLLNLWTFKVRYKEKLTFNLYLFGRKAYIVAADMAVVFLPADLFITVAVPVFYFINNMAQA
jgi:hypothetical protein